jgi:hypothetical protein
MRRPAPAQQRGFALRSKVIDRGRWRRNRRKRWAHAASLEIGKKEHELVHPRVSRCARAVAAGAAGLAQYVWFCSAWSVLAR